jgi:hypothetical protein
MLTDNQGRHHFCLASSQWEVMQQLLPIVKLPPIRYHELIIFILNFCYLVDIDLSVLIGDNQWRPYMNHFRQDDNKNWWFLIKNKDNQPQAIAVNERAFEALMRWRNHLGLTTPPLQHEQTPLLPKANGKKPFTCTATLKRNIVPYLNWIANQLRHKHLIEEAEHFLERTYKWLRRS